MWCKMASIFERKTNNCVAYYLNERIGDKVVKTYLGTKPPLPKGIPTTGLSPELVDRLKERAKRRKEKPKANPQLPEGQFPVILADPPWQYDFVQVKDWGVEAHYPTLPLEKIKDYKDQSGVSLRDKVAKTAVLFLWATPPKLREALEVIEAWGFQYITQAVWLKSRLGMGYWWMQKHELLLLAKKGNFPAPKTNRRPPSIIEAKWRGHSRKPVCIYRMIEKMCPVPEGFCGDYYLECFARGPKRRYWAGFGYEYG